MSKNKSAKKKTAEEKQREFSDAVEKKTKQIEQTEKKSKEFSKAVDAKSKEIAIAEEKRQQFKKTVEEKNKEMVSGNRQGKNSPEKNSSGKQVKSNRGNAADAAGKNVAAGSNQGEIVKASLCTASVIKYVLIIAIVGGVSIAGLIMCVLNIMRHNWFFAVDYLVAALLGISIVIVKVNTLFPTFVACDDKKIIMRAYENRVVPYNISHKVAFLCDFIPAKTKVSSLEAKKITSIIIGTKNYIKRHCGDNKRFLEKIEAIEKSNIGKNTLLGMDMIYIACGNEYEFMSIDHFDTENIAAVVRKCTKINPEAEVLCNNKLLRNKILFDLPSK